MAGGLVTAGLGPTDGTTEQQGTSGLMAMFGTLGVTFIAGTGPDVAKKTVSGQLSVDIDIGID